MTLGMEPKRLALRPEKNVHQKSRVHRGKRKIFNARKEVIAIWGSKIARLVVCRWSPRSVCLCSSWPFDSWMVCQSLFGPYTVGYISLTDITQGSAYTHTHTSTTNCDRILNWTDMNGHSQHSQRKHHWFIHQHNPPPSSSLPSTSRSTSSSSSSSLSSSSSSSSSSLSSSSLPSPSSQCSFVRNLMNKCVLRASATTK